MLAELTAEQLDEWKAYDALDPVGEIRQDLRFATLWSRIFNLTIAILTPKGQKPDTTTPADFMPKWGEILDEYIPTEQVEGQSMEAMKKLFTAIAGGNKQEGKPKRKPKK